MGWKGRLGRVVSEGWGKYITGYIIRTMRGAAHSAYLEASVRSGLDQQTLLLLLRTLLVGVGQPNLTDLQAPSGDPAAGSVSHDFVLFPPGGATSGLP
jgi:hypothetical protein